MLSDGLPTRSAPAPRMPGALLAMALLAGMLAAAAGPAAVARAAAGRFDGPRWTPAPSDSAAFGNVRRRLDAAERTANEASPDARVRMRVRRPLRLAADSVAALLHDRLAAERPADSVAMAQALLLRFEARERTEGLRDSVTRQVLWEGYQLLERRLGPNHPGLLPALGFMVSAHHSTQNLRRAVELGERRVAILDALSPTDSLDLADALGDLCEHRALLGDFARSESDGRRSLAIYEAKFRPADPHTAEALVDLSNSLFRQSRFRESIPLLMRALEIRERTLGPGAGEVGQVLHNLAAQYAQLGDPDSAMAYGERALAVWELPANNANPNIGNTLTLLGQLRRQTGDYEGARAMLERGLAIRRRASAPMSPTIAQALESLAGLLEEMGDFSAALPHREESVRIRERAQGTANAEYANALEGLARLRIALRQPEVALPLAQRAIAIREKALGAGNERLSRMYATLGDAQRALGDPRAALASYERAAEIDRASGQAERGTYAPVLWRLGLAHLALHQPARAESVLAAALTLAGRTVGPAHPLSLDITVSLARAERDLGRTGSALAHALSAERAGRELFRLQAPALSERQALRYANVRPSGLPVAIDLATRSKDPAKVAEVWEDLMHRRGQVLDEMADRRRAVRRAEDAATDTLRRDWELASRSLGGLLANGSAGDSAWDARVRAARTRLDLAEAALGAKSRAFREERSRDTTRFANVAGALPDGTALVAFARYAPDGAEAGLASESRLAAFVLTGRGAGKQPTGPLVVALPPAARVDSLCRAWRALMRPPGPGAEAQASAAGKALRIAVWDPIAAKLPNVRRVLVVPEGELNLVNFSALPGRDGKYLAESGAEFHLLPGERDVLAPSRDAAGRGLFAVGGVSFDAAAGASAEPLLAAAMAETGADRPGGATGAPAWRGPLASCAQFRDVAFAPLPATGPEADRVAAQWSSGNGDVVKLTGEKATEAAVRRWAPGRSVVHLATHGFFVDPRCGTGAGGGRGIGGMAAATDSAAAGAVAPAPADALENPLRLSGLALAGANRRAAAPEGADDGILTAEEIAALDLSGVGWVVLSACDTGVGTVDAGEGVSGLRRALRVAGARTVISSLWAVEDESASRWMDSLYRRRLREGQATVASVNGATRDELARRRAAGESTHPFYWAGFVASGDWR